MKVKKRATYVAEYERDEDGYWTATVKLGPKEAAISNGPTLKKAQQRIRQALSVHLDAPESSFDIEHREILPKAAGKLLEAYRLERRAAEEIATRVVEAQSSAARALVQMGLSFRDAGELLGVTGQRVQQVVSKTVR